MEIHCLYRMVAPSVYLSGQGEARWALESADSPGLFMDADEVRTHCRR